MKKNIVFFVLCVAFLLGSGKEVFAGETNTSSLKQIEQSTEKLGSEKSKLDFLWNTYRVGNEGLSKMLRSLSKEEQISLENLIETFQTQYVTYQEKLSKAIDNGYDTKDINKNILLLKKDFYNSLASYIEPSKLDEYKKYVVSDASYNEKSRLIGTEIQLLEQKKLERIEDLEDQFQHNKRILEKEIKQAVTQKVKEKLDTLIKSEKFQSLSNEEKAYIFLNLLQKIHAEEEKILDTPLSQVTKNEKIDILYLMEDVIQEYFSQYK